MMIVPLVVNDNNIVYNDIHTGCGRHRMADETDWHARVKGILKAELKKRNLGYRDLAERLETFGVHETERNIANKISRGGFSAVFLVQCLDAIGADALRLN